MKHVLLLAILPFIFFSCEKQQQNTNIGFREPNCVDTTDDGIFEAFTNAEAGQFLKNYAVVPDSEDLTFLTQKYITGRLIRNNEIFYDPYFVYKINKPANFYMYLPTKKMQEEYQSWNIPYNPAKDSVKINLYNIRTLRLDPGCYRLYYVFTDTSVKKTMVLSKGHYDIEIR